MFYINNSIIITKLRSIGNNFRYGEFYNSVVSSKMAKKEAAIEYRFSFEASDGSMPEPLEYFDLLVLDILYYLWINRMRQPTFSINDLIYAATGKVAYLQKNRIDKFRHSLEKLSSIVLEIYCFEELEMREKTDDFESVLIGRLAPIRISTKSVRRNLVKEGDTETQEYDKTTYEITEEPILYRYTDINNQIIAVPFDMMMSKGANVKNTDRALLVKYYLIRELELIRKSTERTKFKTQSFNDRQVRFIGKTNNNNCLLQQIDSSDAKGEADQLVLQRDMISNLTKGSFINETKSVKNIVEKYLKFFTEMGYISETVQKTQKVTRNTVIRHICNEFSKRFAAASAEAKLITQLADKIKDDDILNDEQMQVAERILHFNSGQGQKPPYTFLYRSEDERGAVIGVEVEAINDPNSIAWCAQAGKTSDCAPEEDDSFDLEDVVPF